MSLWSTAVLCTDEDLTSFQSRMPEQAKKVRGDNGASAYDNKRALAKEEIGLMLERMGTDPDGLTRPSQLRRAATFMELALIYRDMAQGAENTAHEMMQHYEKRFETEMATLSLEWTAPSEPVVETRRVFATIWRA